MARAPKDRYASAQDLAADVERWLADEPVSAFPEPWIARARRWVRKHRAVVTTAGVALVVLTLASLTGATLLGTAYGKVETLNSDLQDANHNLQDRNQLLVGANRRADHNLRKSRQAVEDYFTIVSESRLLNQPSLAPLRKQLLQTALDYSRGMARPQAEHPVIRGEVAAAHFRVGQILIELGLLSDAVTELLQGLELVERLLKDGHSLAAIPSMNAGLYRGRARNELDYVLIGKLLPVSVMLKLQMDLSRALPALRRMKEILEEQVRQTPTVPGFKNDLAGFAFLAGFVQANLEEKTEAAASYRRAATLWRELVQEDRGNLEYRAQLAAALNELGEVMTDSGSPGQESMTVFKEALAVLQELRARDPATPFYRETTAFVLWNLGDLQLLASQHSEGKQSYREAVTLLEGLRDEYPGVPLYLLYLANTVHDFASRLEGLAKSNSAERGAAVEWAAKYRKLHAELEAKMEKK